MQGLSDLELLIRSRYPIIVVDSVEERRLEQTLRGCAQRLGLSLFTWTVVQGLRRHEAERAMYESEEPIKALASIGAISHEAVFYFKGLQHFLQDPAVVRSLHDLNDEFSRDRRTLVLSGPGLRLPEELSPFAAGYALELPDRGQLQRLASATFERLADNHDIRFDISPEQLGQLVEGLVGLTRFEAERTLNQLVLRDMAVTGEDAARANTIRRERIAADGLLDLVTVDPDGAELAGLDNLKDWLGKRRRAFEPEAEEFGLEPPRGLLLIGVQGCGKSMAATTIAGGWQLPLLRLNCGGLYDKFVGESERRLERALRAAATLAPCVLLIDEIEKALAAGTGDGDAGLSRRILARLLGWLQDRPAPVFVVATCNSLASLPPELMRKGRLDEVFFVDLPEPAERQAIFAAHLRRRGRSPAEYGLGALAEAAAGFSGAEIEQVIVAALYSAFAEDQPLRQEHLLAEIAATRPLSVTRAEDIIALRRWADGRAVPASRKAAA